MFGCFLKVVFIEILIPVPLANSLKTVEAILLGQGCSKDKVTNVCPGFGVLQKEGSLERDKGSLLLLTSKPSAWCLHSFRRERL